MIKLKLDTKTKSNMLKSMLMFSFSFLDKKYTVWANMVQNIKIVKLSWNLVPRLKWICWICYAVCYVHFCFFRSKVSFFGKLGPKIKVVFSAEIWFFLWVIQISKILQRCSFFYLKFRPKKLNSLFRLKFTTETNLNMFCSIV